MLKIWATSDLHGHIPELPKEGSYDLVVIAGDLCPDGGVVVQDGWFRQKFTPFISEISPLVWTWGNHDFLGQRIDPTLGKYHTNFKLWASPMSKEIRDDVRSRWTFMGFEDELEDLYSTIPEGTEIIVSHGPPYGAGDVPSGQFLDPGEDKHVGSKALTRAIERIKPKLVICGHIHDAYGEYTIGTTRVVNVSIRDDNYRVVHKPVVIELE